MSAVVTTADWKQVKSLFESGHLGQAHTALKVLAKAGHEEAKTLYALSLLQLGEAEQACAAMQHHPGWQRVIEALIQVPPSAGDSAPGQEHATLQLLAEAIRWHHAGEYQKASLWLQECWVLPTFAAEQRCILLWLSVQNALEQFDLTEARRYLKLSEQVHPEHHLLLRTQQLCESSLTVDLDIETAQQHQRNIRRSARGRDLFNLLLFGGPQLEVYAHDRQAASVAELSRKLQDLPTVHTHRAIAAALLGERDVALEIPCASARLEARRRLYAAWQNGDTDELCSAALAQPNDLTWTRDHLRLTGHLDACALDALNEAVGPLKVPEHATHSYYVQLLGEHPQILTPEGPLNLGSLTRNAARLLALLLINKRREDSYQCSDDLIQSLMDMNPEYLSADDRRSAKMQVAKLIYSLRQKTRQDLVVSEHRSYTLGEHHVLLDTDALQDLIRSGDLDNAAELLQEGILPHESPNSALHAYRCQLYQEFFEAVDARLDRDLTDRERHQLAMCLAPFTDWPWPDPMLEEQAQAVFDRLSADVA
ncbi:hypothetical protein [Deinococcus ficus]|uniref:Uncharacterized protein n=1 Tax=Deinococcus ficus TaxID=317577 RepID=A0A221T2Y2_9DEIO|nr:hypothetical protein [Deinococcus ficus]ASN83255.1 hypothetical protein DFI_18835 [Deinococcus ficus]